MLNDKTKYYTGQNRNNERRVQPSVKQSQQSTTENSNCGVATRTSFLMQSSSNLCLSNSIDSKMNTGGSQLGRMILNRDCKKGSQTRLMKNGKNENNNEYLMNNNTNDQDSDQ